MQNKTEKILSQCHTNTRVTLYAILKCMVSCKEISMPCKHKGNSICPSQIHGDV